PEPAAVRRLVADLREIVGRADAPILVDQEGGRVQRLKPPYWRAAPPASAFGSLARRDRAQAEEAARLNARLIAAELYDLGITVNCAPVLDAPQADAHGVIGDRAFADDPDIVAALGMAVAVGLFQGGVLPVIKHIPGHGRARADSHQELPVVGADAETLAAVDFRPFRDLHRMPWAMSAHVVYRALDHENPATTSAEVVAETIRSAIGFDGVLVSDDIGMKALSGTFGERTAAALAAGCDVVLHCSGDMGEMEAVAAAAGSVRGDSAKRLQRGEGMRQEPQDFDPAEALARLDNAMAGAAAS
ncbi:MAG: beta-N-acetylhexosaminidase, partial [Rhodospirillales bacterium]